MNPSHMTRLFLLCFLCTALLNSLEAQQGKPKLAANKSELWLTYSGEKGPGPVQGPNGSREIKAVPVKECFR